MEPMSAYGISGYPNARDINLRAAEDWSRASLRLFYPASRGLSSILRWLNPMLNRGTVVFGSWRRGVVVPIRRIISKKSKSSLEPVMHAGFIS